MTITYKLGTTLENEIFDYTYAVTTFAIKTTQRATFENNDSQTYKPGTTLENNKYIYLYYKMLNWGCIQYTKFKTTI